jgi:hypothetical protein
MGEKKKFLLRVDEDLFEALQKWAADDLRSVNAEIEFLLTEIVRRAGRLKRTRRPRDGSDGGTGGS